MPGSIDSFRNAIVLLLIAVATSVAFADEDTKTLTLQSPNGGESWCTGSLQMISWEATNISSIDIFISGDGGLHYNRLASGATGSSYPWFIPENQPAGIGYRIRIQESEGAVADTGGTFTINTMPEIATQPNDVTQPAWGTTFFNATATGVPAPDIEWQVSTDGGTSWNRVRVNTAVGVNTPKLTLYFVSPQMNGYLYRALFTNVCASRASQPAKLTVVSVRLLQPNGGEVICAGEEQTIRWSMQGLTSNPTYSLAYTSDAGETWNSIATVVADTSYNWRLPRTQTPTPRYWVRVTTAGVITSDTSSALFTVNAGPSIARNPNDTAAEQGRLITFRAAAFGKPEPVTSWQVSTDGGTNWIDFNGAADSTSEGRTDSRLVVPAYSESDQGDLYRAIFTNACHADTSAPARLRVVEPTVGVEHDVEHDVDSDLGLQIRVLPNPSLGDIRLGIRLPRSGSLHVAVVNEQGTLVAERALESPGGGEHLVTIEGKELPSGAYTCVIVFDGMTRRANAILLR